MQQSHTISDPVHIKLIILFEEVYFTAETFIPFEWIEYLFYNVVKNQEEKITEFP